ncbi:MAG: hypothetical protein KDA65_15785 [Planctomycetaceae bacterium]|nr:hypothetical protein [Planctomycetaceae bacterium]
MRLLTILLGIVLLWGQCAQLAPAQEQEPVSVAESNQASTAEVSTDEESDSLNLVKTTADQEGSESLRNVYIDGQGNALPLPADISDIVKEWMEFRTRKSQPPLIPNQAQNELPAVNITSITVTGEVHEEIAELELTYKIQVNSDEGAYTVLLGAQEGILTKIHTEGPGYAKHFLTDPEKGYYWQFKGKGSYELKLSMDVKIRVISSSPMIHLSLPTNAPIRNATLLLPSPDLEIPLADNVPLEQRELENGKTEVTFPILDEALNLTWKIVPLVKDKQVVLRANTDIELNFLSNGSEKSVQMKVEQTVQPDEQGSFKTLRIRLPQNFQVDHVVSGKDYPKWEVQDNHEMTVLLKEPATGPITLTYELELRPLESNQLILDGAFQLLNTTGSATDKETSTQTLEQSGTVTIQKGESFLIRTDPQEQRLIRNQSIKSLDTETPISQAFRFFRQPFRLKLEVEEIPPLSSVDAHYQLNVTPDLVDAEKLKVALKANLDLDVLRGELNEINLNWKSFAAEGWSNPTVDPDAPIENLIEKIQYHPDSGQLQIRFLDPITEKKQIRFATEKTIDLKTPELDFTLPYLNEDIQRRIRPSVVSIISPPNLATELTPNGKTTLLSLSSDERAKYRLPGTTSEQTAPLQRKITSAQQQELHLDITALKRKITAKSNLRLQELIRTSLQIQQEIELDVKYDPLNLARLYIPPGLVNADFEIRDAQGKVIQPEKTTSTENTLEILIPPSQTLGTSKISINYHVEQDQSVSLEENQLFQIPYFTIESTPYENMTLNTTQQSQYEVRLDSADWKPIIKESSQTWQLNAPNPETSSIAVQIVPIRSLIQQDFQIPLAIYHIDLRSQEKVVVEARYLVEGSPEQILITMPDNSQNVSARWDGTELVHMPETGKQEWQMNIPASNPDTRHKLFVTYRLDQTTRAGWLRTHRVELPRFSAEVWTPQCIAEVSCPYAQPLLTLPEKWAPLYSWQREGIFWYRRSNVDKQENELYRELQGTLPIHYHYQYDFGRPASGDSISFHTISLSMLVFYGAGSALLCGFLFRRLNALQNSFAFSVLLFGVAFAGLWYWSVIQIFIQPALIGTIFAMVAVGIEELLRRRHSSGYEELGSSFDLVVTAPRNSGILSRRIGSEDSTALRAPSNQQISVSTTDEENSL